MTIEFLEVENIEVFGLDEFPELDESEDFQQVQELDFIASAFDYSGER